MRLPGRDLLQAIINGELPPSPIISLLGDELLSVADGEPIFGVWPDEASYNPVGMVHGGLLRTMLDTAAGAAVHTMLPPGTGFGTIEIKVSFIRPLAASDGTIILHGHTLRVGRSIAFAEAHARNRSVELVGHATRSIALTRPASAADTFDTTIPNDRSAGPRHE